MIILSNAFTFPLSNGTGFQNHTDQEKKINKPKPGGVACRVCAFILFVTINLMHIVFGTIIINETC